MWFDAASPAAADKGFARFGLIFQLNGGRALRGTLVAVVRSTLKRVGRDESVKVDELHALELTLKLAARACVATQVLPSNVCPNSKLPSCTCAACGWEQKL